MPTPSEAHPGSLVFADLHVHLGRAAGRPVKISASASLTVEALLAFARAQKGLDVLGLVDAATTGGLADLRAAVAAGRLHPLGGGGLAGADGLVILPGAEIELLISGARVHFVAFVPDLAATEALHDLLRRHVTNPWLSSQMARGLALQGLWEAVTRLGGMLWAAHAFTPHRGLFGCAVERAEAPPPAGIGETLWRRFAALELGLSADSAMADRLSELSDLTYLSNSDAHSLETLARECNLMRLNGAPDWDELRRAILREGGRGIAANFGLVPALGKYHRTACARCGWQADGPPPVTACPTCGSERVVLGVLDRLTQIADRPTPVAPPHRPAYRPQVLLRMLPGVGPATARRLVAEVGPELHVLHRAELSRIAAVAGERVAEVVGAARTGALVLRAGGGGRYGAVLGSERHPGAAVSEAGRE